MRRWSLLTLVVLAACGGDNAIVDTASDSGGMSTTGDVASATASATASGSATATATQGSEAGPDSQGSETSGPTSGQDDTTGGDPTDTTGDATTDGTTGHGPTDGSTGHGSTDGTAGDATSDGTTGLGTTDGATGDASSGEGTVGTSGGTDGPTGSSGGGTDSTGSSGTTGGASGDTSTGQDSAENTGADEDGSTTTGSAGATGSTTGNEGFVCEGPGFDPLVTQFDLPGGYPEGTFWLPQDDSCSTYDHMFQTFDVDGDARPDIVITAICYGDDAEDQIGTTEWIVHLNAGDAFEDTATQWTLPTGYDDGTFVRTLDESCSTYDHMLRLADMNGDARPDLVITGICYGDDSEDLVGTDHWVVHLNDGTGFEDTAITWDLPSYDEGTFFLGHDEACSTYDHMFELLDIDGDADADLVITGICYGDEAEDLVGTDHWIVHLNDGSGGFGDATTWSLPAYDDGTFWFTHDDSCSTYDHMFELLDIDGDARPDLVITGICYGDDTEDLVGTDHWIVHLNDGSGFESTATIWTLPAGYDDGTFWFTYDDACSTYDHMFHLRDLDGDADPDIVITGICYGDDTEDLVGTSLWLQHENTGTGFASTADVLCLPPDYPDGTFWAPTDQSCSTYDHMLSTRDLDGDADPDLVISGICYGDDTEDLVGTDHWWAHLR